MTRLSQDKLDEIDPVESPTFDYAIPNSFGGEFCGYSGYWKLQIPKMGKETKAALRSVYKSERGSGGRTLEEQVENGQKRLVEINPLEVLIVSADYDFTRWGVLSKYNEFWTKEYGGERYAPIVKDADVIMREWRLGPQVARLPVILSESPKVLRGGPKFVEPLRPSSPLRFLVLGVDRYEDYIKPWDGISVYVVDQDVRHLRYSVKKKEWVTDKDWQREIDGLSDTDERSSGSREGASESRESTPSAKMW